MFGGFTTGERIHEGRGSFTVSPVEGNGRVGLCRAVELHKVALENRLGLHGEVDQRKVYKGKEKREKKTIHE